MYPVEWEKDCDCMKKGTDHCFCKKHLTTGIEKSPRMKAVAMPILLNHHLKCELCNEPAEWFARWQDGLSEIQSPKMEAPKIQGACWLHYLDYEERRYLGINPFLKEEILALRDKVKQLLESKKVPETEKNENKCKVCGLRKECKNEKFILNKLKQLNRKL